MPSAPEARSQSLRLRATQRLQAAGRSIGCRLRQGWPLAPAGLTLYLAVKGVHPDLPGWPCPLRRLTGIPCPTCYLTRATAAALSGQLEPSLRLHAFGPLVAIALIVWSVAALHRGRLLPFRIRETAVVWVVVGLLLYWLLRLLLQFGFGLPAFVPPL